MRRFPGSPKPAREKSKPSDLQRTCFGHLTNNKPNQPNQTKPTKPESQTNSSNFTLGILIQGQHSYASTTASSHAGVEVGYEKSSAKAKLLRFFGWRNEYYGGFTMLYTGWWFQFFLKFSPLLGENRSNLTSIFFRWVGSTTK